jgi:hypothetical protein
MATNDFSDYIVIEFNEIDGDLLREIFEAVKQSTDRWRYQYHSEHWAPPIIREGGYHQDEEPTLDR